MPANYNSLLNNKSNYLGATFLTDDLDAGSRTLEVRANLSGTAVYDAETIPVLQAPPVPVIDLQEPAWSYRYQLDLSTYTKGALTVDVRILKRRLFEAVYAADVAFEYDNGTTTIYYNDPLLVNTYLPLSLV